MNEAYEERLAYLKSRLLDMGFALDAEPEGAFIFS